MIRILIVDDQKMVREALKISLEPEKDLQIVGTASNGFAAIDRVKALQPDVVLMNMEMPGLDGASTTKEITNKFVNTKVLILTSYDTDDYITKSLAMGAKGYLLKDTDAEDIAIAIRNIYKGYTQIGPGLLEKLLVYTDSGVILSKLKQITPLKSDLKLPEARPTYVKTHQIIANLQSTCRKNQAEIDKLNSSLNNNIQELPKIRKNITNQTKYMWLIWMFWLLTMPIIGLTLFNLHTKTYSLQMKDIPPERIGIKGEFSLHGIAQRVTRAFEEDPLIKGVSTVYVAQEQDAIVLTGKIADTALLRRMENIAKTIEGVDKVYTSQVIIQRQLTSDILGVEK